MATAFRVDSGTLGGARKTPQGGLIAPANMTRVGVLTYYYPDGSKVRELRHPDDVFKADSLATLAQAPLTVLHPAEVTPANWRQVSVGHVDGTPKQAGNFVAGDVRIMDGDTIAKVDSKELTELSCGYRCDMVQESGVFNGEAYDARQTNIKYNHVALGPKDWGRAGNEVRLRLDGQWLVGTDEAQVAQLDTGLLSQQIMSVKTDSDGKTVEAPVAAVKADDASEALRGQVAFLRAENDRLAADLATVQDPKRLDSLVSERVALVVEAAPHLGKDFKADGLTAHAIRSAVVAKLEPGIKLDGATPDFVQGIYTLAVARTVASTAAQAAVQGATPAARADAAPAVDSVLEAERAQNYRSANAWRGDSWLAANPYKS